MPSNELAGFIYRFVPPDHDRLDTTLLLLHGTGGNENDLLPLGKLLIPGAGLLGLRGQVLENGMPRFFRRIAEGVFDLDDLKARTDGMASFIEAAVEEYHLKQNRLVAVGYSNGANIAASLLLSHPHHLAAAVLFRAMVPFRPDIVRNFNGIPVFIGAGRTDAIVGPTAPGELAALLSSGGANVTLNWHNGGHELAQDDINAARTWLGKVQSRWSTPAVEGKAHGHSS